MKKKRRLVLICALFIITIMLATGCAPNKPAGKSSENSGKTTAMPGEVIEWTVTSPWPGGTLLQEMGELWAEKVEEASGGRMRIDVYPADTIVGALEILDAVDAGTVDAIHNWTGYWLGHHPATTFFSSTPMLWEPAAHLAWFISGNGAEYHRRLYQEELNRNVVPFTCGATHSEILAYANVPLAEIKDWKGAKYRTVGWWAEILKNMGVSVTTLPGAEVYPSLERGVIDAAEFSSPAIDIKLGFHEIADYYTGPGIHQPSNTFNILINKDAYDALPEDLKYIVEMAATATTLEIWSKDVTLGIEALETYDEEGLERVYVDPEYQKEFREEAWTFIEEEIKGNKFAEEVWEDAREFYLKYIDYDEFMIPTRDIPEKWKR